MEAIMLSFSMAAVAALFISKNAKQLQQNHSKTANNTDKKSKRTEQIEIENKNSPPYYERFISHNKRSDDFLDYSGGLLGI